MSLEPAIALLIGLAVLHQVPGWGPFVGIAFVVAAGIGVARSAKPTQTAPSTGDGRRREVESEGGDLVGMPVPQDADASEGHVGRPLGRR
jgi:inner membrane transporter RhtA